jgi:A/G-specific adenine glycosylase
MKDPLLKPLPSFPVFWHKSIPGLQKALLAWHQDHGRHQLPWKQTDPYAIWVSEIMLQQTQVTTVIPKYKAWMTAFPTIHDLASAPVDDVLKHWEGLGYYSRARNIHKSARLMDQTHGGRMPKIRADRLALPGIGPSTASAIGAFAFGQPEAIFDGNVRRVWARWWGDRAPVLSGAAAVDFGWAVARAATPDKPDEVRRWTQAIMDLGATVCTPRNPRCTECPWQSTCRAKKTGTQTDYPVKIEKAPRKTEDLVWEWRVRDGRVAILPPADSGKWAGLWRLPAFAVERDGEGQETTSRPGNALAGGTHDLTHRRIFWDLRRVDAFPEEDVSFPDNPETGSESWQWVDMDTFNQKAWPRFVRRWWDALDEQEKRALFIKFT